MGVLASYPKFQAFNDDGTPLSGGLLYTYEAGTSTLKSTYADQSEEVLNTNPIELDSNGEATLFLGNGSYKFILNEPDDSQPAIPDNIRWTQDDIQSVTYGHSLTLKTADYTFIPDDLNGLATFTNTGATADVTYTLPEGDDNYKVSFLVTAAQTLKVQASGTDKFRWGQEAGASGGYISSEQVGTYVNIVWSGSEWVIVGLTGDVDYLISGTTNEGSWSLIPSSMDEMGLEIEWVDTSTFQIYAGSIPDTSSTHILKITTTWTKTTASFASGTSNGALQGTLSNGKFANIYIVKNTTSGAVDFIIEQTTGTPSLPTGYTVYRWLGVVYVNDSGELVEWEFTKGIPHKIYYPATSGDEIQIASLSTSNSSVSSTVDMSDFFPTTFTSNVQNIGCAAYDATCTTPGSGCASNCYYYMTQPIVVDDSGLDAALPDGGLWTGTNVTCTLHVHSLCTTSASSNFRFAMITFTR